MYQQKCEICKKTTLILFDARIRLCKFGPRGHWLFLCPVCHFLFGLGYGDDYLIIYENMGGKFYEVKGGSLNMKTEDIREAVREMVKDSEGGWQVILLGEISVQLAAINTTLEKLVGYMAAIESHMKPAKPLEHLQLEVIDGEGDNN